MTESLNVVKFTGANVNDIPQGLRNLADLIESNSGDDIKGEALVWIVLDTDGAVDIGALGKIASQMQIIGLLEIAKHYMIARDDE